MCQKQKKLSRTVKHWSQYSVSTRLSQWPASVFHQITKYWDLHEIRDLFQMRVFKWCFPGWTRQKWYGWVPKSQRSLIPTLRILNTNLFLSSQQFFYEGCYSAICTKHRTVSTSKLELALFGGLQLFQNLFRKKTLQNSKHLLSIYILRHEWYTWKPPPIHQPHPQFFLHSLQDSLSQIKENKPADTQTNHMKIPQVFFWDRTTFHLFKKQVPVIFHSFCFIWRIATVIVWSTYTISVASCRASAPRKKLQTLRIEVS